MMRGAIFDMDGTLLDSTSVWNTVGERYLRSIGLEPRENLSKVFFEMDLYDAARYYQREYGVQKSTDEIMSGVTAILEHFYTKEARLKPGTEKLLALLHKKGIHMCVATATDRPLVEAALGRCGVLPSFEKVFTCGEVGRSKSDPYIYETARRHLGTQKSQTWVFEDARYAIWTAKRAGFPVAAVYDAYEPSQSEVRMLADIYLEDMTQRDRLSSILPA